MAPNMVGTKERQLRTQQKEECESVRRHGRVHYKRVRLYAGVGATNTMYGHTFVPWWSTNEVSLVVVDIFCVLCTPACPWFLI